MLFFDHWPAIYIAATYFFTLLLGLIGVMHSISTKFLKVLLAIGLFLAFPSVLISINQTNREKRNDDYIEAMAKKMGISLDQNQEEIKEDIIQKLENIDRQLADRVITPQQEKNIIAALMPATNEKPSIRIHCICTTSETRKYADRWVEVFSKTTWSIIPGANYLGSFSGILITGGPKSENLINKIILVLENEGIKSTGKINPTDSEDANVSFIVGFKE